MSRNDNQNKNAPREQKPDNNSPEIRVLGCIILGCIGALFIAATIRAVQWMIGPF